MDQDKAGHLITLCNRFQEYLQSGASDSNGIALCEALKDYGLEHHSAALSMLISKGDGARYCLPEPWADSICYLAKSPPGNVEPLSIWFDPYEVNFMIRTVNPSGHGKATIGWISISPVFYWQYHVFQRLVRFSVRDSDFLQVKDLLSSRPFGVDKWDYASDLYHEEAVAYAFWHGKWIASNLRIEALTELVSKEQLHTILPTGMSYWDASFSGSEDSRVVFNCSENQSINKYFVEEWDRSKEIGFLTAITDQVGLIADDILPRNSGECLALLNCSRKI